MNEYQINVSLDGAFLFRSEWDDDRDRAIHAAVVIKANIERASVTVYSRSKEMTRFEVEA